MLASGCRRITWIKALLRSKAAIHVFVDDESDQIITSGKTGIHIIPSDPRSPCDGVDRHGADMREIDCQTVFAFVKETPSTRLL